MLAAISVNHAIHQKEHGYALQRGFERHGIKTEFVQGDTICDRADFHVTWSIKRPRIFEWSQRNNKHVLVMERGHVGDRMNWTSMGWDGLGNRGKYAKAPNGDRWNKHWSHLLQPWKDGQDGYALLLGQCTGDASLYGLTGGFEGWAQEQTNALMALGYAVKYRPHPLMTRQGNRFCPKGATLSITESLYLDLQLAALAVSYNSTAGVEAVLAGVRTIALDEGSMAWPVASQRIDQPIICNRTQWTWDLSWSQFTLDEIQSGFAWEAVQLAL